MAGGACDTGVSGTNIFIEILHLGLVIWNIYTDFRILFEMKSTLKTYHQLENTISSSPTDYEYTFCFPQAHVPLWYDRKQYACDCVESNFNCNNNATIISPDISCETEIFGFSQQSQQTLQIQNWICQECKCNSTKIFSNESLPVQRFYYEYDTMTDLGMGHEYCDPYAITDGKIGKENDLQILINFSIVFLVIGIIAWCGSTFGRGFFLVLDEVRRYINKTEEHIVNHTSEPANHEKTSEHEAKLIVAGSRMGFGFLANMLHDIPHQVLLLFYVRFLYADYGYICFKDFANAPKLNNVAFNSNEDLLVILARNYRVFSSVFAWSALVLFNAVWNTYQTYVEFDAATRAGADTILKEAKRASWVAKFMFYLGLTVFLLVYITSHWCWPAYFAYNVVAPALHKEWMFAKVVFWSGVWVWGVLGILIVIVLSTLAIWGVLGIFPLFYYCIKYISNC